MEQTKPEVSIKDTSKKDSPPISVYNFSEVELPVAVEKSYEDFVTYGEDNLFPQSLITAWLQSSIHNALTTGIVQMIAGAGLKFTNEIDELLVFKRRINRNGDTLEDLINKTAFDLYLQGYFGWQLVWNQTRTKIVEIYHTPAEQIRSGKADDAGAIENYYISWDWAQYRKKKFHPTKVPALDLTDRSAGRQMMFVKQYRPNQYYYSTPSYIGGMNWILMDNRVGEFHLNNIENGFFPSSVVQFFNGEPPQEEKRNIELGFMQKFTGKAASKIVFVYNNNQDERVSFDTYEPANIDKRFRDLMPEIAKNIMIAHRVPSPLLFGIRDSGGLGNNAEELESSSVLMNKLVIVPFQQIIVNSLAEIFRINGWGTELTIDTLQPGQFLEGDPGDAETGDSPEVPPIVKAPGVDPIKKVPVAKEVIGEPEDIQKSALNGAQISSLLEVISNVTSGLLSKESAKAIITASFPSFSQQEVNEIVDNIVVSDVPPPEGSFSLDKFRLDKIDQDKKLVMPDKMVKPVLAHLDSVGSTIEELAEMGYVLVQDDDEMTPEGLKHKLTPDMFAAAPDYSDVEKEPEDPGFFIVRYQYRAGRGEQDLIETSREFCSHMMTVNASKLYSFEEIQQDLANPQFPEYNIYQWKGSYNCRHRWAPLVWFRTPSRTGNQQVPGYRRVAPDELPVKFRPPNSEDAVKKNPKVVPK